MPRTASKSSVLQKASDGSLGPPPPGTQSFVLIRNACCIISVPIAQLIFDYVFWRPCVWLFCSSDYTLISKTMWDAMSEPPKRWRRIFKVRPRTTSIPTGGKRPLGV